VLFGEREKLFTAGQDWMGSGLHRDSVIGRDGWEVVWSKTLRRGSVARFLSILMQEARYWRGGVRWKGVSESGSERLDGAGWLA
jgi:hypothetical protein